MPKKNTNCCKIEHSELNTQFNDKKETTTGRQHDLYPVVYIKRRLL